MNAPELMLFNDCRRSPGSTKNLTTNSITSACGGNTDDDGWFKFTALSERTQISLSTDQLTDMAISVFQNCSIEVECIDGKGIGGQEILKFDTQIGEVYFIQVYEVNEGGAEFLICVSALERTPQVDCIGAAVICEDGPITFNPEGSGSDDFAMDANQEGCLLDKENQAAWYYFEIQDNAPPNLSLHFTITPETSPDYDFAIFGPDVLCEDLGYPIRCSWADAFCSNCPMTGLENGAKDATEGADGDGFVAPLIVQPGEGYFLLVDNYWQNATGFFLEWGGEAAPFLNCDAEPPCGVIANAGFDLGYCEERQIVLNGLVKSSIGNPIIKWAGLNGSINYLDDPNIATPIISLPPNFKEPLSYAITASSNGCSHTDSVFIKPNCALEIDCSLPIKTNFDILAPSCANPTSGSIQVGLIEGGTPPYLYQINNSDFQLSSIFSQLMTGGYSIKIVDALGCQLDTIIDLPTAISPTIEIGDNLSVDQGESIDLQTVSNILQKQIKSIHWSGIDVIDCPNPCLNPSFIAHESATIQATLTTFDGCEISDELQLIVQAKIDIYIPSAFSPNGDGINDIFTIFTGTGISTIQSFKVFDRWGNLVFQALDFPSNQENFGWDGKFQNRLFNNQIFLYFVEIELPDGTIKKLSGEVVLVL